MMPVPCRLAIALTVVAFASNSAAQESCKASIDTAAVSEVRDGRTLLLADGRELRLAAIEVTEASRAVLQSLAARQTLRLEKLGPGQDRYGRLVAFAYTGDMQTSLQQTMIEQGHAQVSARIGDKHCADLLLARERAARAARRGIWADPNFAPLPSHDVTRITAVRGLPWWKARSCRCGRAAPQYMLISGGDFAITILKRHRRDFAAAGIDPKELEGRRVRVRGWVEQRRGPMIEAATPEQIEVVR